MKNKIIFYLIFFKHTYVVYLKTTFTIQNKIDSLTKLLQTTEMPADQRESAMSNVEHGLDELQQDFDQAVAKHENEKLK